MGTSIVILSTYLYNSSAPRGERPPPIQIHSYEKTTIDKQRFRDGELPLKLLTTPLKNKGLSSSRPGSPEGHHSRRGSSRGYFGSGSGSKDRDD